MILFALRCHITGESSSPKSELPVPPLQFLNALSKDVPGAMPSLRPCLLPFTCLRCPSYSRCSTPGQTLSRRTPKAGMVSRHHFTATTSIHKNSLTLTSVRRRDMTLIHKKSYIRAVRCLQTLPAKNNSLPAKFTRFDEFVISHVAMANSVHGVVGG